MDAEFAALLSMTIAGGIPVVVTGAAGEERQVVRDALVSLWPADAPVVRLSGPDEDFAWMPQAGELGWRSTHSTTDGKPGAAMIAEFEPGVVWGEAAHLAIRALTAGYSLLATATGSSLDDALARLAAPPVLAIDDELTRLGVVLVLGDDGRLAIAHYLRPVARDPGGHVQRLPPASLAAWNAKTTRFDHFAWGVVGELAGRTGRRPLAFEREQALRIAAITAATGS
ncbi:MAG: hypothetical protein U0838_14705 [Chloroflexota bacterium]